MMTLPLWAMLGIVFLAGGLGALIRHAATVTGTPAPHQVRRRITAVNVVGAFFAGVLVAMDNPLAFAITVGLFGSLTTFSTIAVWMADDIRQREPVQVVKVVLWHVLLGVPAVLAGFLVGQIAL
jgi:fluoride exporter